jgi:ATP-dependent DNA ligase
LLIHVWSPWQGSRANAARIRATRYLGVDGISDFNGLHSRRHNEEVQLYAFDCLAIEGDDLRRLPLHLRKTNLVRVLASRRQVGGKPALRAKMSQHGSIAVQ